MPIIKIEISVSLRLKEFMDIGLFIFGIDFSAVKLRFVVSLGKLEYQIHNLQK